jgi:hypothetical protein
MKTLFSFVLLLTNPLLLKLEMHTRVIRYLFLVASLGIGELSYAQNNLPAWNRLPECKGQDISQGVNCFGSYIYDGGANYVGQFKNGKRHGLGTFTWAGNKYEGQFEDDDFKGRGTLIYADGSRYFGQFLADKSEGQGIYLTTGGITIGEFVNDEVGKNSITFEKTKKISMIEVINACENQSNSIFYPIAACIKLVYGQVGSSPSSRDVKNFIRLLDGISEDFNKKAIGIAKAKAELIKAWQSTIDASNKINEANARGNQTQPPANNMAEQINQLDLQRKFDQTNRILESGKPCYPASNGTRICP